MRTINNITLWLCLGIIVWNITACSEDGPDPEQILPKISEIKVTGGVIKNDTIQIGEREQLLFEVKDNAANITKYEWFINERRQKEEKPTFSFQPYDKGIYKIKVSIQDKYKQKDTQEKIVKVTSVYDNPSYVYNTLCSEPLSIDAPGINSKNTTFKWILKRTPKATTDSLISTSLQFNFTTKDAGTYQLMLEVKNNNEIKKYPTVIYAKEEYSPYIAKVFDYMPGVGQFVNELPGYEKGDTQEDMIAKVQKLISGEDAYMITLGGFGGYVTFGFDHTIENVAGKRDFRINGNAFGANANPRPDAPFGGSCEPGIIMVAYDKNKNGKPDENEWYEIAGSSYSTAEKEPWYNIAKDNGNDLNIIHDYEITYYRPTKEKAEQAAEKDNYKSFVTIPEYIRWEDNKGNSGYKVKNVYHEQSYYPLWIKEDSYTLKGTRLPKNGVDESGKGNYYVLYGFRYGYVDNYPNLNDNSAIDIDWAVDKSGNKVQLSGIDFIRVHCGINQENGWLGEASTEVEGAEDLHLLGKSINSEL